MFLSIFPYDHYHERQGFSFGGVFWTKFEHFFTKTLNDCALRAQNLNARAGKKEGVGGKEFLPALAFRRRRISCQ